MSNGTNENDVIQHKRRGYLNFFKDGVYDAIIKGEKDPDRRISLIIISKGINMALMYMKLY
jgi:hypothetical protein